MANQCQLPILDEKLGEVRQCQCPNGDVQVFNYQGNDFYFCPEHYKMFSENINNLYSTLQKEVEEYINKNN